MTPDEEQLLHDAIARNAGAVISLPSAGMFRHHKTRLLAGDDGGFWVEAPPGERALVAALIVDGQPIGLSLKAAAAKFAIATPARQFKSGMQLNPDTAVDALQLAWPAKVKAVQRRAEYRVAPSKHADVRARAWRVNEHQALSDRPAAAAEVPATLCDLSVGGMRIACAAQDGTPKLETDGRLRAAIVHAGGELIVEGRVRHIFDAPGGGYQAGVQFQKLEDGIEGRRTLATLTQIVGHLQRDEIRRRRLTQPRSA